MSWGRSCHCSLRQSWEADPGCKLNSLRHFIFHIFWWLKELNRRIRSVLKKTSTKNAHDCATLCESKWKWYIFFSHYSACTERIMRRPKRRTTSHQTCWRFSLLATPSLPSVGSTTASICISGYVSLTCRCTYKHAKSTSNSAMWVPACFCSCITSPYNCKGIFHLLCEKGLGSSQLRHICQPLIFFVLCSLLRSSTRMTWTGWKVLAAMPGTHLRFCASNMLVTFRVRLAPYIKSNSFSHPH